MNLLTSIGSKPLKEIYINEWAQSPGYDHNMQITKKKSSSSSYRGTLMIMVIGY